MTVKIPVINHDENGILSQIRCFALDMDGTIYLGEQWIDGAVEFLRKIEASGRNYVFLTNNSSKNAEIYVDKLQKMGLEVKKDKIVTSGQATIYLFAGRNHGIFHGAARLCLGPRHFVLCACLFDDRGYHR